MSPTFTEDDVGKTVESAAGENLGAVVAVDPGTAYVEPEPGMADSIKAALDWEGDAEGVIPLADDAVDRVTDEAIRLEGGFPTESLAPGTTTEGADDAEELEAVEDEASRELEVDPTELTDEEAAEISPYEDVGRRGEPGKDRSERESTTNDSRDDLTREEDQ